VIAAFHAIDRDTDLARLEYLLQLAEREQLAEGTA
jgi:hypothetical protein